MGNLIGILYEGAVPAKLPAADSGEAEQRRRSTEGRLNATSTAGHGAGGRGVDGDICSRK